MHPCSVSQIATNYFKIFLFMQFLFLLTDNVAEAAKELKLKMYILPIDADVAAKCISVKFITCKLSYIFYLL